LQIYDHALQAYIDPSAGPQRNTTEILQQLGELALKAGQPEAALRWFDRVPALAPKLAELRAQLERAARSASGIRAR
jgi:hypothetical protein